MGAERQDTRKKNLGRLDHVARKADRVTFPADFGKRYVIFVDTEEEFDWTKPQDRNSTGTSHVRYIPEFQNMAESHGVEPCYLVDWPIVDTADSAEIMAKLLSGGKCAIGTQLHPWVNPPFEEEVNTRNSFVANLPVALQRAKLHALTDKIEAAVGKRPTVYRAGRYGIGSETANLLIEAGYKVDTSIRPYFDYSGEEGPDFRRHNPYPAWAGPGSELLNLPLSVAYVGQLRKLGPAISRFSRKRPVTLSALSRSGMLSRIALTPEDMPAPDVKNAIDALLRDGHCFLSFSFHSPSVAPGHTPYVRNSAELSDFYRWWDVVLNYLAQRGVEPASIQAVIDAAWRSRS